MNPYDYSVDEEDGCDGDPCSIPAMTVFDYGQLKAAHDAETKNSQRREALSRMLKSGPHRRLAVAEPGLMGDLEQLARRQPNCETVIARIRRHIALSLLAEPRALRWPPLLLDGPPGVGKTYFARALAELLRTPFFMVNCSSVTASFVLGGNSASWAGSRPGKIADALRDSVVGNPIVLLDEVDKLSGDSRFDGYGPLYQLLEEDTAKIFEDEHIGVPVDASQIMWLATSNNPEALPEPIRSRFEVVSINKPSMADLGAITQSIYDGLLDRESGWKKRFAARLPADVKTALSGVPPREIRRMLTGAMGQAAVARSASRSIQIGLDDLDVGDERHKAKMGFLA
ncbi:AAA family ATPase [Salinisphaera aquimarina]|uniref:AAA family ATPase n=1 Tax=Salinisphaera aquimarina TaxID=2094031 RepID=A0ABV7EJH1_9GAMM